jgi:PilZ domain
MARVAARSRTADAVLPAVNALVRLTIGSTADPGDPPAAGNVPSRIEDVQPADPQVRGSRTQLFVAVPHYPGDVHVPRPGTACTVTWVSTDGLYDLPAGFVERVVVGPVVWAWRVEVTGRAQRAQRRQYVRVPWRSRVRLDVVTVVRFGGPVDDPGAAATDPDGEPTTDARAITDAEPTPDGEPTTDGEPTPDGEPVTDAVGAVHGDTLDLSEGGIRCVLPPPPLPMGQPVRVHLTVQEQALLLDGTVVRVKVAEPKPGAHPVCETGICFTEPDEYGDLLRKAVFSEQLRLRRSGVQ